MDWKVLFEQITKLFPRLVILDPYERGVKLRSGKFVKLCQPGIVFLLPFVDDLIVQVVVPQNMLFPHQSLMTEDGTQLSITCGISYSITDPIVASLDVDDVDEYIQALICRRISEVVCATNYEDCYPAYLAETIMTNYLRDDLKKAGVTMGNIFVYDLTPSKTFRLLSGDQYSPEDSQ